MHQVFAAITADTTSLAFNNTITSRTLIVLVSGSFGGGDLNVEVSGDNGVSFAIVATLAGAGIVEVTVPDESQVRLDLNNSTVPVLSAWSSLSIPLTPSN